MQAEKYEDNSLAAFILTFFTFFLDNVLLTVVVPMLAPWVQPETGSGEADKSGRWAAAAGTVLGAKAGTQLLSCGAAAAAVRVAAPTRVLRAGTMLLLASSVVLCTVSTWRGPLAAGALLLARVFHGAGAALASVAGWAVCARRPTRLRRLLPATAAGVMAGYVLGAVSEKGILPFALIAAALAADLALQYKYLGNDDYSNYKDPHPYSPASEAGYSVGALAAAGGVFVSAAVVATLEPCLPTILHTQCGVVFISDSVGYLVGGCGRGRGRRGAAAGLLTVAVAAALTTLTTQVWQVCITQFLLGLGIGTIDVALFPAVIAPDSDEIEDNLKNNITQKLSLTSEDKAVIKDINTHKIGDYKQLYYNNDILDSNDESDNTHSNPFIHICDVTTDDDEENEKNRRSCEDESLVKNKDLEELLISAKLPCLENTAVLPVAVLPVPLCARDARSASHAALLHGASSAACAIGGVAGGLCAWWASLDRCLLALAALNALYAAFILRVMPTQVSTSAPEKKTREPKETSQLIAAK